MFSGAVGRGAAMKLHDRKRGAMDYRPWSMGWISGGEAGLILMPVPIER
jgi:hypothetical protein